MIVEKQSLPIFLDGEGEPRAIIFYNKNRKRIIYTVQEAGEEEMIELLECKDKSISTNG